MAGPQRFETVDTQGKIADVTEIWVDRETGVNYVFHRDAAVGGLAPLLDRDGRVAVSPEGKQRSA